MDEPKGLSQCQSLPSWVLEFRFQASTHVKTVIPAITAMFVHFRLAVQFNGFSGSSGPSQLITFGSVVGRKVMATSWSSFLDSAFSRSLASSWALLRAVPGLEGPEADVSMMSPGFSSNVMIGQLFDGWQTGGFRSQTTLSGQGMACITLEFMPATCKIGEKKIPDVCGACLEYILLFDLPILAKCRGSVFGAAVTAVEAAKHGGGC